MLCVLLMTTASFAQTPTKKSKSKNEAAPAEQNTATPAKTKKDGTPDMRYKENKEAPKPAVKTKKDGTPDMRYKDNKKAAPTQKK